MNIFAIDPILLVYIAIGTTVLMTIISFLHQKKITEAEKKLFFWVLAIPILIATFYMAAHTVHENVISQTGGPVHWHLDYQVHVCGERLNLVDPTGLSNKIGTPLFHEHNDDRVHVEGTVVDVREIDLGSYFATIGGTLTNTRLRYNTEENGYIEVQNGDLCNGVPAELAVYINGERIEDPENYLYFPHPLVPPADCAIVTFEPTPADTTDKLCESWFAKDWNYDNYEQIRQESYSGYVEDHARYQAMHRGETWQ